ncbi:hypothetical protein UlMin_003724 [Ulmus minor]
MGFFSKFFSLTFLSLFLLLLFVPANIQEQGFVSVVISDKGLDFAKDLLVEKAISSIIPLQLPQIEKYVKIPVVGRVQFVLSNIPIYRVDVPSSYVENGETGVVLVSLQSMEVGVTVSFEEQEGTLKLSVLESGCYVQDISIKMNGGASWLYQGLVDAFEGKIESLVEDTISSKIREGIMELGSLLQSLPKQIEVYDMAAMNVSFVGSPVLSNSSIELDINGLFMATNNLVSSFYHKGSVELADYLHWIFDKVPDQFLLNTSRWKYDIPLLYKKYPDDAMDLNISVSSPPVVKVVNDDIEMSIYLDVIIDVLDADEVVPVACVSLEISASCSPKIVGNKLVGTLELKGFTAYLKWSKIGNLHIRLVQSIMSLILKTTIIPYANLYLWKGLPLPLLHGFTLQNAEISCTDKMLVICSDVAFAQQFHAFSR